MYLYLKDTVELVNYSNHHIHIKVQSSSSNETGLILGFYRYPETHKRQASWSFFSRINPNSDLPWCLIGDFNEILNQDEK